MPVPWLVVGQLVLGNLDRIIAVVKPAFTGKKTGAAPPPSDLVGQQIAELQGAAANNAEQIAALAIQLKEVVAALELAGQAAAAERALTRRIAVVGSALAVIALGVALVAVFGR